MRFSVGYFDGRHQMSLVNLEDLRAMYSKYKFGGELMLWCDKEIDTHVSRKRESETGLLKHQEREDELESIFKDLKAKNQEKYTLPQLRLWALEW